MAVNLKPEQQRAVKQMRNGCILCGGVGSGKSRTSLAFYFTSEGGKIGEKEDDQYLRINHVPRDLYIITTAKKRDSKDWNVELACFAMKETTDTSIFSGEKTYFGNKIVIDSWNNIAKYKFIEDSFFIFDEQRVSGKGPWVKAFLNIAKHNKWVLLSATPGDKWEDYIPVFVANGFYRNPTEFYREHCVFSRFAKFPKIDRYLGINKLVALRDSLLVDIPVQKEAVSHHENILVEYDRLAVKTFVKTRWDPFENKPIQNAGEFIYVFRRIVNIDPDRLIKTIEIVEKCKRAIIFYNYNFELELLKNTDFGPGVEIAEWNGNCHQEIPETDSWVYLVQYNAGAEGWNCIKTDTIIFFSMNYSYRTMVQSAGRIDRLNTPYRDLYFYHLKSAAPIDLMIDRALKAKKKFNERAFYGKYMEKAENAYLGR